MPITFVPKPGMVLMCEFGPVIADIQPPGVMTGPLSVPPEMTKRRFVIILTPSSYGTCIVVPLSTKVPAPVRKHHYLFKPAAYPFLNGAESWLKADMLMAVSHQRLDRVIVGGKWTSPYLAKDDFEAVKSCVRHALGL